MLCFLLLFGKKFPWTAKSAREIFQKSARERTLKCPWKRPKKCPWTHPLTREFSPRSAREPKKVPVNIFQKIGFTGTFDVHGGKKNTGYIHVLYTHTVFFFPVNIESAREPRSLEDVHGYFFGFTGTSLRKFTGKWLRSRALFWTFSRTLFRVHGQKNSKCSRALFDVHGHIWIFKL